jgi:hypothetical protein
MLFGSDEQATVQLRFKSDRLLGFLESRLPTSPTRSAAAQNVPSRFVGHVAAKKDAKHDSERRNMQHEHCNENSLN